MGREKSTLAIFAISVILMWFFSTSFLVFSSLFFISTIILTIYISHKYLGAPSYKEILKEISSEYRCAIKNNKVIVFIKHIRFFLKNLYKKYTNKGGK